MIHMLCRTVYQSCLKLTSKLDSVYLSWGPLGGLFTFLPLLLVYELFWHSYFYPQLEQVSCSGGALPAPGGDPQREISSSSCGDQRYLPARRVELWTYAPWVGDFTACLQKATSEKARSARGQGGCTGRHRFSILIIDILNHLVFISNSHEFMSDCAIKLHQGLPTRHCIPHQPCGAS